jgi:uncharacterized cupin superfamily protein
MNALIRTNRNNEASHPDKARHQPAPQVSGHAAAEAIQEFYKQILKAGKTWTWTSTPSARS